MSVFEHPDFDQHESVHFFTDEASGLRAIIAIHSTALGPAAGGCRFWRYASSQDAVADVLRLSRGMSFKNALADLPLGGGKAVILDNPSRPRSPAMMEAFGRAVESLGGRYLTAEDIGTTVADMQVIARQTKYVSGLPSRGGGAGGDPSPKTALGVFLGLMEAWRFITGSDDLNGATVAVQGLGGVGYHLCKHLHEVGAKLLVADVQAERIARVVKEFGATSVSADEILSADADIIAPCALGAVLNANSIPRIRARLIAGAANNQLARPEDGLRVQERGIVYAPDYVINAGGIINVAHEYLQLGAEREVIARIQRIPHTLRGILERSKATGRPTSEVADLMARERIAQAAERKRHSSTLQPKATGTAD